MKNRFAIIALFASIILPLSAYAQAAPPPSVNVSDHCTVTDTDGNSHSYAQTGQFLGICALAAAREQGAVSSYALQNFSFGLFLQSLNGTVPGATEFWNIYQNGAEASVGLSDLAIATGDIIKFQLTDFTTGSQVGSPVSFQIGTLTATPAAAPASSSGVGGSLSLHAPFDVTLALAFLEKAQKSDGSFDSPLLSDWAAVAFAVGGAGDAKKKLAQYFIANPPALESITDYERHAMALQALGINPYSGTPVDYITPIVKSFDGRQIGDAALVNDDIFAVFPFLHAGYSARNEMLQKIVAFIVSRQSANGSWENSVDLTAAAVQALSLTGLTASTAQAGQLPDLPSAITRAANYIRAEQQPDGGFGNSFGTSWTLQAIAAVPSSGISWEKGYFTPQYYLATRQQSDGGVEPANMSPATRLWATAYAIPAIKGKTWDSLLSSYDRPVLNQSAEQIATSTAATTTTAIIPATALPAQIKSESVPEKLPDTAAPTQEAPMEQAPNAFSPEPAANTEATTTPIDISPQLVQTAAAAAVDFKIPTLWKWILAFLSLSALIAGAAQISQVRTVVKK